MSPREPPAAPAGPVQNGPRARPASSGPGPLAASPMPTPAVKAIVKDFSFSYGAVLVLKHLQMRFADKQVTALIGPSGCGKTTLLRCFNRLHDLYPGIRYTARFACSRTTSISSIAGGSPRDAPAH